MQIKYIPPPSTSRPSLLRKAFALIATVAAVALALMFSAVLLAVILIIGTIAGAYLWWKTREVRKLMRNFPPPHSAATQSEAFEGEVYEGEIIEGEVVRTQESRIEKSAADEAHHVGTKRDTP